MKVKLKPNRELVWFYIGIGYFNLNSHWCVELMSYVTQALLVIFFSFFFSLVLGLLDLEMRSLLLCNCSNVGTATKWKCLVLKH
jgi:hypothetical protein